MPIPCCKALRADTREINDLQTNTNHSTQHGRNTSVHFPFAFADTAKSRHRSMERSSELLLIETCRPAPSAPHWVTTPTASAFPRLGPYLDAPRSRSHVPGTPHEISRHRIYRRSRYRTATLEMGGRSDPPKRPRRDQIRGGSRSRASDRPGAGSQKAKANPAYARALMAVQNEKPRLQGGSQAGRKSQVGHSANADAERRCPNYIRQIENGKRKNPPA